MTKAIMQTALAVAFLSAFGIVRAGTCGTASLIGAYSVAVEGYADVSRVHFNGQGVLTFSGSFVQEGGAIVDYTGSGSYTVNSSCVAAGSFTNNFGSTATFRAVLNRMDIASTTNLAYGARGILSSGGLAGNVIVERLGGKF